MCGCNSSFDVLDPGGAFELIVDPGIFMFNRYFLEFFIALRYLRGQGRTVIFSLGTRLSFVFMSLMVFIMVLVLSVFNGFQNEVHNSLWDSGYHVTITRFNDAIPQSRVDQAIQNIHADPDLKEIVRSAFGAITVNGLIDINGQFQGKPIRALPVYDEDILKGQLRDFPRMVHFDQEFLDGFNYGNYVIIGREMARYYNWRVGDKIRLILPREGKLSRDLKVQQEEFRIAGFFRTGFYEFDMNLIYMSLDTARRVLYMPDSSTEIIVQLNDLSNLSYVKRIIRGDLPGNVYSYNIRTIKDERGNFLAALQLEKTLMIIIMGLLIVAGIAGIWVTVYLLVKSKSKSIGMLRAMGLPVGSVIVIFTANSMLIGFLSTAIGGSLGMFTADRLESIIKLIEEMVNSLCSWYYGVCAPVSLIPKHIYYFDHLPVYADMNVIFGVALTTLILSGLAGYFPSRSAARMDPVTTIRND